MTKKDLVWFLLLYLVISLISADAFWRQKWESWSLTFVIISFFLIIVIIFYLFKIKKDKISKTDIKLKYKFFLALTILSSLSFFLNKYLPPKSEFDPLKTEEEINALLLKEKELIKEIDMLRQKNQFKNARMQINKLVEISQQIVALNQKLIAKSNWEEQKILKQREKILENFLEFSLQIQNCLNKETNISEFEACQKEIERIINKDKNKQ